jgi:hypothetical protein
MTSNEAITPPREVVFTPIMTDDEEDTLLPQLALFRTTEKNNRSSSSSPTEETLSTGTPVSQYSTYNKFDLQRKHNDGLPKKSGSPSGKESVIDNTRRTKSLPGDDGIILYSDAPPGTVALPHLNSIMRKAIILDLHYEVAGTTFLYTGQAGIVKDTATGVTRFYTALHNITDQTSKSTTFLHASATLPTKNDYTLRLTDENFNLDKAKQLELSPHVHWAEGFDVTTGFPLNPEAKWWKRWSYDVNRISPWYNPFEEQAAKLPPFTSADHMFEKIGSGFEYSVDMKIAMVVSSVGLTSRAREDSQKLTEEAFSDIFGPCGAVTMYSGSITAVGRNHIEHTINTYPGCSGAIIFLLDSTDQLDSVDQADLGKAIAVHVGYKDILKQNIGMQINGPNQQACGCK